MVYTTNTNSSYSYTYGGVYDQDYDDVTAARTYTDGGSLEDYITYVMQPEPEQWFIERPIIYDRLDYLKPVNFHKNFQLKNLPISNKIYAN